MQERHSDPYKQALLLDGWAHAPKSSEDLLSFMQ